MANENTRKVISVALSVCLVCSVLVSTAAVLLREKQEENRRLERVKNILEAAGLWEQDIDADALYKTRIRSEIVELKSGELLDAEDIGSRFDPEAFSVKAVTKDPSFSRDLPQEKDLARIQRIPTHMVIYRVTDGKKTLKTILPIYGMGLWSKMYGFIALDQDWRTISGFTFYEHAETPGLGGEIDNPRWKALWIGKQAFDSDGRLRIRVVKGSVDAIDPERAYRIDGLSGSTLTTRGVDQTVRFWLGDDGYGPFIRRMREEG